MDDAPQNDINRGTISLEPGQAKAAPVAGPIGNPLWAIPLSSLSITQKRPLFTPSRRPPSPAVVAPPVIQPKVVAKPAEPEHPRLTLIGTVVGETDGIGVFLDQTTQGFVRLKTGEEHSGWVLKSVKPRSATLEKAQQKETLSLPTPQNGIANAPASNDPL
jgi:general secretion pathway protein N